MRPDKGVQRFFDNVCVEDAETAEEIRACLEWTCPFCSGHSVPVEEGGQLCNDARIQAIMQRLAALEEK